MNLRMSSVLLAVMFVFSSSAICQRSFPDWCIQADAVVVGKLTWISASPPNVSLVLTATRILKGPFTPNSRISLNWSSNQERITRDPIDGEAIWFLRSSPLIGWEIIPIVGPHAPLFASGLAVTPEPPAFAAASKFSGTCPDLVAEELAQAGRRVNESPHFLRSLETLLGAPGNSLADGKVQEFARSGSPEVRFLALSARLRAHDVSAVTEAATSQQAISSSKASILVALSLYAWRTDEPEAVRALGRIATFSVEGDLLRGQAAESLSMIHSVHAIPFLAQLLNSHDTIFQEHAVKGLSLFVNGVPPLTAERVQQMVYLEPPSKPSAYVDAEIAPYVTVIGIPKGRTDEYVHAWQRWWQRQQKNPGLTTEVK